MNIKTKNIKIIAFGVILYFTVIFSARYYCTKLYETQKFQRPQQNFVILSTTTKPRYRFLLPIAVAFWRKLGVQVIIIIIKDKNVNDSEMENTYTFLKDLGAIIKIFSSNKLSTISLSQIIRLFGAVLPSINQILTDDSILMTSDADIVMFNLTNHIPDIANGKTLHIHNIACCGPVKVPPMRGNHEVKMYSMSTIGATIKTWKDIMGFKKNVLNIDEIEEYVIAEFGNEFFNSSVDYTKIHGEFEWYADQSLFGYKIDEWLKRSDNKKTFSYDLLPYERRIDRAAWPTPEKFINMKIENYDDCHQPIEPYANGEWEKYKPFLEFAFKNDKNIIKRFSEYRKDFIKYK